MTTTAPTCYWKFPCVKVCRNERGELYPVHLPEPRPPAALTGTWGELIVEDVTFKELTDEHNGA